MCRIGPCPDGSHHGDEQALDGPAPGSEFDGQQTPADLPARVFPDAGPRGLAEHGVTVLARQRGGRRGVLGGLMSAAAVACAPLPGGSEQAAAPRQQPVATPQLTAVPPTAVPPTAVPPTPVPTPVPAPEPKLTRLAPDGVVQPFWSPLGRIQFYDQPAPGNGGTWAVDLATGAVQRERAEWGYYVSRGTLLATARTQQRDTYVQHLPTGRHWTLPTTNSTVFSPDGTVVAFTQAATGQPGGPPAGPGQGFSGTAPAFALTTITVAGADGQDARRIQLPINGSVTSWLPAPDGTNNARLLLSGRRGQNDDPSIFAFDVRDRSLVELARSKRLVGILPSPDGTWVAHVAMWNANAAEDGLWVTRSDGSQRRRVELMGGCRWTEDNRLLLIPVRSSAADGHEVWEVVPGNGAARQLVGPDRLKFRIANCDFDCAPDGSGMVFVSAEDRGMWHLSLPVGIRANDSAPVPVVPEPSPTGTTSKPYRLPFAAPPGPSTWYVAQWYGVTTGGFRGRNSTYSQGQGIHFGIDFAAPCGTPVVAVAAGKVIAVDGDFGSSPHNVVLQLFDGNIAMYGHLVERTRHVQVGQTVVPGQVVGNTGDSVAPYNCTRNPHLHLEIRKGGRAIATNLIPYFDVNWDDLSLGVWPGPRFERDLDNPRRFQFMDDQPDIWFGGPIISNFARPWPP